MIRTQSFLPCMFPAILFEILVDRVLQGRCGCSLRGSYHHGQEGTIVYFQGT
jgi:hypothetical protein